MISVDAATSPVAQGDLVAVQRRRNGDEEVAPKHRHEVLPLREVGHGLESSPQPPLKLLWGRPCPEREFDVLRGGSCGR